MENLPCYPHCQVGDVPHVDILRLPIFSKVKTVDGIGTVVGIQCQKVNGLYYDPACTEVHVWYGMDNVSNGWVRRVYQLEDVTEVK